MRVSKSLFKSVLKAIGAVLALLVLSIAALLGYAAIDKVDTFYVKGAELQDPNWLETVEAHQNGDYLEQRKYLAVYAHRIHEGNGTVFGYRFYSNGNVLAIDDEGYEKLTIWVSNSAPLERELDLSDSGNVVAVYTKGGSAWPGSACAGFLSSGRLTLKSRGESIEVHVSGTLRAIGNRERLESTHCRASTFDRTFTTDSLALAELTTWLGKAGNHVYAETYR